MFEAGMFEAGMVKQWRERADYLLQSPLHREPWRAPL
jgi:hypothetical protein